MLNNISTIVEIIYRQSGSVQMRRKTKDFSTYILDTDKIFIFINLSRIEKVSDFKLLDPL